ncbi:hypothetical protein MGYG_00611 [Nannizzia gypsea CBS 118893]|uniref:Kinetochore protein mis14 n=1 Tax=Arthroderma gypseum (strain ATCC MYA-4604 / CBS 118893) TaxID=535722 RepID=E5R0R4_ARTGP|nr:hypothetical protein MGYG_00611 [Nannizzia gypsea CBS 118893]EFQ97570.1 hypothetical protein MGYG_00611 [Nannizzia gypsea CBS 118893]
MQEPHHRKIELQSTADLSYLYTNTLTVAREKIDLHFPPSANDDSDPMKERVRNLVDGFINKTFTSAIPSISINGIDTTAASSKKKGTSRDEQTIHLESLLTARESIEYEPFDTDLAARLTSLYAQLESLTTTVAQMRRDAPLKAAKAYEEALTSALLNDDDDDDDDIDEDYDVDDKHDDMQVDADADQRQEEEKKRDIERIQRILQKHPEWLLQAPVGTEQVQGRWRDGDMSDVYARSLETLFKLQGEGSGIGYGNEDEEDGGGSSYMAGGAGAPLATTVGKAERARLATGVVEKM